MCLNLGSHFTRIKRTKHPFLPPPPPRAATVACAAAKPPILPTPRRLNTFAGGIKFNYAFEIYILQTDTLVHQLGFVGLLRAILLESVEISSFLYLRF